MYKTILTICFSAFLFVGCSHTNPTDRAWIEPDKPVLGQPNFVKEGDRLYLSSEDAVILRNNLIEMKAYQEKLEILIKEMKDYYH